MTPASTSGPSREAAPAEPVKIVYDLRARPGDEPALEAWTRRLMDAARRVASVEGSSVLAAGGDRRFVLLRFASARELDRWRASPDAAALVREGARFTPRDAPAVRTGLETWFALPGGAPPAAPPPRWKMALVTWGALLPQVIVLAIVLPESLPFLAGVAVSTAIPVVVLTWFAMPRLTRLLAPWLYPSGGPR